MNELSTSRTFVLKKSNDDTINAIKEVQDLSKVKQSKETACGVSTQQV